MATVNIIGFGHNEAETVGATKTLDLGDSGVVQDCPVTTTITLPATVVGTVYLIRVAKAGITVTISPNASDKIAGGGFTPVDDKDIVFTNQPAGSFVELTADGVNGYMVSRLLGTATYQG
jgi:hypothetical protein